MLFKTIITILILASASVQSLPLLNRISGNENNSSQVLLYVETINGTYTINCMNSSTNYTFANRDDADPLWLKTRNTILDSYSHFSGIYNGMVDNAYVIMNSTFMFIQCMNYTETDLYNMYTQEKSGTIQSNIMSEIANRMRNRFAQMQEMMNSMNFIGF